MTKLTKKKVKAANQRTDKSKEELERLQKIVKEQEEERQGYFQRIKETKEEITKDIKFMESKMGEQGDEFLVIHVDNWNKFKQKYLKGEKE